MDGTVLALHFCEFQNIHMTDLTIKDVCLRPKMTLLVPEQFVMIAIAFLGKAAVATAIVSIGTNVIGNVYQTYSQVSKISQTSCASLPELDIDETRTCVQNLRRKELVSLFLQSEAPHIEDLEGDWEGCLLENNGWIMTQVSSFCTHILFSNSFRCKRRWIGKSFESNGVGINRFRNSSGDEKRTHKFDFKLSPSKVFPGNGSIELTYSPYQKNPLSLWKSMVDELRVLRKFDAYDEHGHGEKVLFLLGMGSMGWSGGMYNAAPFLLWKKIKTE